VRGLVTIMMLSALALPALAEKADKGTPGAAPTTEDDFLRLWQKTSDEVQLMLHGFPELPPELNLELGFRYLEIEGAGRVREYGASKSFPVLDLHGSYYTLTQRMHAELRIDSPSDFDADVAYRFKNLFAFRGMVNGLRRNLDRFSLVDLGADQRFTITDQTRAAQPTSDTIAVQAEGRLFAPGYPAKLFVKAWVFKRKRDADMRMLGGSGYFDALDRFDVSHRLETLQTRLDVGANAHVGPVELEYAHVFDAFTRSSHVPKLAFTAGTLAGTDQLVDMVPAVTGSRDTIKLHTAATGRLVLAVTGGRESRENRETGASGTIWSGTATLRATPAERFTLGARYDVRASDWHLPATITVADSSLNLSAGPYTGVRPMSGVTQTLRTNATYRPSRLVSLLGEWSLEDKQRSNAEDWHVAKRTVRDTYGGRLMVRPSTAFELGAGYKYETVDSPAYNWDPTSSHRVTANLKVRPLAAVTASATYELVRHQRNNLQLTIPGTTVVDGAARITSHNVFATVTVVAEQTSLSIAYGYQQFDDRQTMIYQTFAFEGAGFLADRADYASQAHLVALDLSHAVSESLSVGGRGSWSSSESHLDPSLSEALAPVSLGTFSSQLIVQTRVEVYTRYAIGSSWGVRLSGGFDQITYDRSQYNPARDGKAYSVAASVQKSW
jgi:hypothetical protein